MKRTIGYGWLVTLPASMGPAQPSPQRREQARYPRVISQEPGPPGHWRVTFSLPGLRRLTATVPEGSWLLGEHLPIGVEGGLLVDRLAGPPDL